MQAVDGWAKTVKETRVPQSTIKSVLVGIAGLSEKDLVKFSNIIGEALKTEIQKTWVNKYIVSGERNSILHNGAVHSGILYPQGRVSTKLQIFIENTGRILEEK